MSQPRERFREVPLGGPFGLNLCQKISRGSMRRPSTDPLAVTKPSVTSAGARPIRLSASAFCTANSSPPLSRSRLIWVTASPQSASQAVRPIQLLAVEIVGLDLDAKSASATLTWTPYSGPRFAGYRIYRSIGSETRLLETLPDVGTVAYVDTALSGGTEYSYRIDVVTEMGEQIPSLEVSDGFHLQVSEGH